MLGRHRGSPCRGTAWEEGAPGAEVDPCERSPLPRCCQKAGGAGWTGVRPVEEKNSGGGQEVGLGAQPRDTGPCIRGRPVLAGRGTRLAQYPPSRAHRRGRLARSLQRNPTANQSPPRRHTPRDTVLALAAGRGSEETPAQPVPGRTGASAAAKLSAHRIDQPIPAVRR